MTVDERSRIAFVRLRAELVAVESSMELLAARAHQLASAGGEPTAGDAALIAVSLHGWYNAVESTLERIAVAFEGEIPRGGDSHRALLRGMTLDLGSVRPPVIARDTELELVELLKFRHFFRHAYTIELDWSRLLANVEHLNRAHPLLSRDLAVVMSAIDAIIAG